MGTDLFFDNGGATCSSGGTTAPASGTVETWTLGSIVNLTASTGATQVELMCGTVSGGVFTQDSGEIVLLTNLSGTTATVTRGVEGTTTFAHTSPFQVQAVASASALTRLRSGTVVLSAGALTFTNMPSGDTDAQLYSLIDFTSATEARFAYALMNVTGPAGSTLRVQWYDTTSSTWKDFGTSCTLAGSAYAHEDSGWVTMTNTPTGLAQIRLVTNGGTGTTSPKVNGVTFMWR